MCWEHLGRLCTMCRPSGSSPHARGALSFGPLQRTHSRIIPACAGSTGRSCHRRRCGRDHPRMRGEHNVLQPITTIRAGSSPHARGAHIVHDLWRDVVGIIPACAGSTPTWWRGGRRSRDHPRMRGEHERLSAHAPISPGSSPHARGAPWTRNSSAPVCRIIPACAGSTS